MTSKAMEETLAKLTARARPGTPQEFAAFMAAESEEMVGDHQRRQYQGGLIAAVAENATRSQRTYYMLSREIVDAIAEANCQKDPQCPFPPSAMSSPAPRI